MPQPAGTYNDGTLVFGSQSITFSSVAYIADNIDYGVATKVITRTNVAGVPVAETLITEVGTGSMQLQIPSTASVPALGSAGSIVDADGATSIPIKLTKIGRKFVSDGETKLNVEFRQKLN